MRIALACALVASIGLFACSEDETSDGGVGADAASIADAANADAIANADAENADAIENADAENADAIENADATEIPDATEAPDAGESSPDATEPPDSGEPPDATEPPDAGGPTYNCGLFAVDPGWTVSAGYRAVVIADATANLSQPVALTFAQSAFGNVLYVVNQGNNTLITVDVNTGSTTTFTPSTGWSVAPVLLTSIIWDRANVFDGNLYVADQGSNSDGDSRIFRVTSTGTVSTYAEGPGPGLDDVFGLAFSLGGTYPAGLYVSGDTDGAGADWGLFDLLGAGTDFSFVSGVEGIAFGDINMNFGGLMYAARPLGGGYDGDGTITPILSNGTAGQPLASNLGGVHASVFSPGGAFGTDLYSASWSSDELIRTSSTGATSVLASGLQLTNYDGNILDFSPDGNVLFVADREANRVVCIEPL